MISFAVGLGILLFATAAAWSGYSLISDVLFRDRRRIDRRIDEQFRDQLRTQAEKSPLFRDFSDASAAVPDSDSQKTVADRFRLMLSQSGLNLRPQRLLLIMAATGLGPGILAAAITQNTLVGLVTVAFGAILPVVYVHRKRKQRQEKLLSQLPDAFDLMARAVRAGNSFWQAVLSASQEFEAPLALELAYCHELQNLGLPKEVALRDLASRSGLVEMRILGEAVTIQEQTGGNLAEILDKLARTVRERFRIVGKVRTLTAEGQMQAVVLLALAPGMFLLMLVLNFEYTRILFDWNHSILLIGTLICEGLGWLWIRRIVNFDF